MSLARKLAVAPLVGLTLLGGCGSSGGAGDLGRARPDQPGVGAAAPTVPVGVPQTATLVDPGQGWTLNYQAPQGGRVYLYDVRHDSMVYFGPLHAGEKFSADPASSIAKIDGDRLDLDHPMKAGQAYQLWFDAKRARIAAGS